MASELSRMSGVEPWYNVRFCSVSMAATSGEKAAHYKGTLALWRRDDSN
jgi:hypothetical protein